MSHGNNTKITSQPCKESVSSPPLPEELKLDFEGLPLHTLVPCIYQNGNGISNLTTNLRQVGCHKKNIPVRKKVKNKKKIPIPTTETKGKGMVNSINSRPVETPRIGMYDPFITEYTNSPSPYPFPVSYNNRESIGKGVAGTYIPVAPRQYVPSPGYERPGNHPEGFVPPPPGYPCDYKRKQQVDPLAAFKYKTRNTGHLNNYRFVSTSSQSMGSLTTCSSKNTTLPINSRMVNPCKNTYKIKKNKHHSGGSSASLPISGEKYGDPAGRDIMNNNVYPVTGNYVNRQVDSDYLTLLDPKRINLPTSTAETRKRDCDVKLFQAKYLHIHDSNS